MAGASDIGQVYSAVEKLAARSENDAEMLYEEFLSWDNFLVVTMTANVLVGLSSLSLKKAHNYALSLFNSEKLIHKQIGIFALGRFHYNVNENYHEFLASTLAKLKTLQTKPNPETDHIIAEAYGNLIDQSEEALVAFLELASRQDDLNLKSQIAKVLYNKAQKNYSKEWYKKAIFYLIKPPLLPPALLKQFIDYCIIYYAKTELTTALEVIEHLAINWDYINHQDDNKLPQVFNHTFLELYNNQREHFIDAFTRWFASNKPQLHIAALYIQEHFDSIPSPELNENTEILPNSINLDVTTFFLSKKVIDNLDDKTFEYLLYRMCGYIRDGQSLAALIISALRRESNSPDIQNKITDLLTNYVLYNYPHHVSRFLKRQLEINDLSELQRNVIQSALESYDANVQKWRSLPHLKELTPSSKRTYLLQLAEWKYIASIAQKARQQSIFYNLMSHKPIKYGRAFSVEQNGEFTDPIKLKAFSYEQELPQGEYIDPVGQTYRRFQWRNIGLSNDEAKLEETVSGENNL
ncbi:MAG TPA: hypothetical protein VK203_29420, partial [Nostocaceae cyanobacterium]|nr:hypothetical protein [Nostocaceae cyanobacterium]